MLFEPRIQKPPSEIPRILYGFLFIFALLWDTWLWSGVVTGGQSSYLYMMEFLFIIPVVYRLIDRRNREYTLRRQGRVLIIQPRKFNRHDG